MALAPNVFISWSKERGKAAATALHEWLPMVIQAVKPWMSDKDIDKGTVWLDELTAALGSLKQGIICLTPESLSEPWLLYEAGVISKALDRKTRVWTYLLANLKPSEVPQPLGLFQHTVATEADTFRLLESINNTMEDHTVRSNILKKQFEMLWPELAKKLSELPAPTGSIPKERRTEDILAELLELARADERRVALQSQFDLQRYQLEQASESTRMEELRKIAVKAVRDQAELDRKMVRDRLAELEEEKKKKK
jgi:hypothetical protein